MKAIAAVTSAAALAAATWLALFSGGSSQPSTTQPAAPGTDRAAATLSLHARRAEAREDCSTRSEADFPGAWTDPRNLVVGPLVIVGGAYTDARTVREFGGNKFPLLVRSGHTVTVRIAPRGRRIAGLAYGPLPQGKMTMRDSYRSVTFVSCRPGKPSRNYSEKGPSGTFADGVNVTFWSGFILSQRPSCIPLLIYVDGARSPQRLGLSLGRRCGR